MLTIRLYELHAMADLFQAESEYDRLLRDLKEQIRSAQVRAFAAAYPDKQIV